jgi:hypothetical protein
MRKVKPDVTLVPDLARRKEREKLTARLQHSPDLWQDATWMRNVLENLVGDYYVELRVVKWQSISADFSDATYSTGNKTFTPFAPPNVSTP